MGYLRRLWWSPEPDVADVRLEEAQAEIAMLRASLAEAEAEAIERGRQLDYALMQIAALEGRGDA